MEKTKLHPEMRYCRNCGQKMIGFRTSDGYLKLRCPKCNAVSVSKKITRRHEEVHDYAPPGQEIVDN